MARSILANHATSGCDQLAIARSVIVPDDWSYGSIVTVGDRWNDQSWHPVTERTITHGTRRAILRSIVAPDDRSCDQAWGPMTTDRTINRATADPRSSTTGHTRLVVRSRKTYLRPLTIWNCRLDVLNMTIDFAATDYALAITHYFYDQSCVLSTISPRFQK